MSELTKPANCTCQYQDLIARNLCGHTPPCPVYLAWKEMLDAAKRPKPQAKNLLTEALECVRLAVQLSEIATDWNLDEVEIDKQMVSTYDLTARFRKCLRRAKKEAAP